MVKNTIGEKIIYTTLKDLLDISYEKKGLNNPDVFKEIVDAISKQEYGETIYIKKPTIKKETETKKVKTIKTHKKRIIRTDYNWQELEEGYEYCEEIQFADGAFATRDASTKDIIGAVDERGSRELTFNDKTILAKLNF